MKRHIPATAFFIVLLIFIFSSYKDYGIAWDEKVYIETGRHYLIKIFDLFGISHNLKETKPFLHGGVHIKTHGVFFDIVVILTSLFFKNFNLELYHLIKALYSSFIFLFLYLIVAKLLNQRLALMSLIFLLLFPRFTSDIFFNSIDIPTTLFFTIALYYFFYFIDSKQNFLKQIFFGLLMALIINQRAIFWYFMILNLLFLFVLRPEKNKKNLKQLLTQSFVILASTIFFMHLTHPYLFAHPVVGIYDIIREASKGFPFGAAVLFEGKWYQAGYNPLPWYYLPKSILITSPLITLILFFLGSLKIVKNLLRPQQSSNKQYELLYLLSIFSVPFLLVFFLRPILYDSWRQFLFLTIPMIIIAMSGLDFIIKNSNFKAQMSNQIQSPNVKKEYKKSLGFWILKLIWNLKFVICILIIINLFLVAKQMILLHPYEYLYYNSLVGSLRGASGKYETDYWGLGYKEAVLWFNQNLNDPKKQYKIFVEGDPLSSYYYFKPNMRLTADLPSADYLFTFTRWNFHIRHPGKTIYTVEKEGVPLIFIKKVVN
ncbi:hypothetical protein A3C98_04055 [Candidatus Roizmanbacteria bacterium RIFCSPHIGHO2_02_FULL_37_15]|uniref:Glycosyltransferase RgtA/B/C/D-like domain-containing protein n=1 Tax=Candidatus Roizmanbacteria bacterium RIFCSPLOWO2_01_FULL_37_16 TaxID=1802058 RepID=A0A1F7IMI1_9BACT|nr:MAG: hypothetical protein A2859_04205 [Candidatus Roizmanbacteria bacterium RIFCSPHIGHO2_01_FULL_37_16b]OGK22496.1 MAG: hypothetical protein A3C98_04055 [Candidatus Roizmanbacteria bacterium RIFCSPHIGHO2_02_FULL_37_15]OGK33554.1 MAG: hypothetical protein A3F57_05630 [Candidatus Roizmanbacteria bacterium RIFCSPHIGHO2_12_FULL_36_11]OGK44576.1 MAG: hypothetical protein A3B40_05325 [Candidatus Roizmanbacteria bacterium RIFCSPLOWO2_01_FULL_37_16]